MIRIDPPSVRDPAPGASSADAVDSSSPPDGLGLHDDPSIAWSARAGRPTVRAKAAAGVRGLKHALRGDSSFFAHAYRTLLVALTAGLLGVGPLQWCLIALAATLILISELTHSAIDTLARALGDPDSPGLTVAREIASANVLVSVIVSAAVYIAVFTLRLNDLLRWW